MVGISVGFKSNYAVVEYYPRTGAVNQALAGDGPDRAERDLLLADSDGSSIIHILIPVLFDMLAIP
jgi:hypothetical protein